MLVQRIQKHVRAPEEHARVPPEVARFDEHWAVSASGFSRKRTISTGFSEPGCMRPGGNSM